MIYHQAWRWVTERGEIRDPWSNALHELFLVPGTVAWLAVTIHSNPWLSIGKDKGSGQ